MVADSMSNAKLLFVDLASALADDKTLPTIALDTATSFQVGFRRNTQNTNMGRKPAKNSFFPTLTLTIPILAVMSRNFRHCWIKHGTLCDTNKLTAWFPAKKPGLITLGISRPMGSRPVQRNLGQNSANRLPDKIAGRIEWPLG